MRFSETDKENTCEHCRKPLFGRTDKRFCNDTCRNTFNRNKAEQNKLQANENIPEIFRAIKKNYELLLLHGGKHLGTDESAYFEKETILKDGFNPRFFTSVLEIDGELWRFCFERGWIIGDTHCMIRDVPEQATTTR